MPASPTDPNPAPPRGALWAVLLLVALAPLVVHHQLLSDDLFLYTYDAGQSHLARFQIMGEALSSGRLPLWQNIAYGGSPFLANPENPALYPPAMIAAALLPPLLAMNLMSVLHLSLAALGMALLVLTLARRCGLAPGPALAGALLAAVLFSLNWYTRLEHLNLVTYGAAHALIPWILLAVDRVLNGSHPRRAAGALALALAAQISTGGLYVVTYTALGLVLWVTVVGLCGNASSRRRALTWCLLAAGLAVLAGLSRLLPYRDWVAVTNRATSLDLDFALGRTLGGHNEFSWSAVANRVGNFSGGYAGIALGLLMLPTLTLLRRRRSVAGAWLLVLVGALVALGPGYEWLYRWVPPFDRVRNALRGWTLVNATWPLLVGLGFAVSWQFVSRRWGARSNENDAPNAPSVRAPLIAAAAVVAAVWVPLLDTGEHAWLIDEPFSRQAVLQNYPNWTDMAEKSGDDWRAMALNVRAAGSRNEQFIAAALGVESPAGFMGYAYPVDLARHLYTNYGTLAPKQRLRRAKALSVRHATVNEFMSPRGQIWEEVRTDPFPGGVDGPLTWDDDAPRPRAFLPASVGVILGDDPERKVLYAVYDAPGHRADVASLVSLDEGTAELPPAESVDALVVIECAQTATAAAIAWIADVERLGTPVARVSNPPLRREIPQLSHVAKLLGQTERAANGATFARNNPESVTVDLPADSAQAIADEGRWLVLSESWHLWGGWTVDAGRDQLEQHRADGVATAVWLPQGSTTVSATYDPKGIGFALTLGAAAVIVAAALLIWPRREA